MKVKDKLIKLWDLISGKPKTKQNKLNFNDYYPNYLQNKENLKNKIKNNQKIKVGFFVVFDSVFSARPLYEKMLEDDLFEPSLIVIPDVCHGDDHTHELMNKTYNTLSKKYEKVIMSYNKDSNSFVDYSDELDLVCSATPYDIMTHEYYTMNYLKDKGILLFHINYAYMGKVKYEETIFKINSYKMFWKIFIENSMVQDFLSETQDLESLNTVVTGYCKMDELSKCKKVINDRKKIIIAPHHTVRKWKNGLELSNFLKYADFFLELPKLYPEIDFVFRPHPLLFINLRKRDSWGEKRTEKYLFDIQSNKNLIYSDGGEYFNIFASSDALIHDCGSFLPEYFYTDSPQYYILKDKHSIDKEFLPSGKQILENVYKGFSKKDILNFIDNVVIRKNDHMKQSRLDFANKHIKVNYPNVSDIIIKYIKEELTS